MKRKNRLLSICLLILIISILFILTHSISHNHHIKSLKYIEDIKNHYNKYVITIQDTELYDADKNVIGKIGSNVEIVLKEKNIASKNDDYFELEDFDNHYVFFDKVKPIDTIKENNSFYKNYIVFNENCVADGVVSFYDDNLSFLYQVNTSINAPIYIKEDDFYGVEFNDKLVYLKKDEVSIQNHHNTDEKNAKNIPVLLYHFFHTHNQFEGMTNVIYLRIDKFEDQMKYLNENNFMTLTMKDLELYIKGKVQIKENSVVITIDDGNQSVYDLAYPVIEKYGINATVFAITAWDSNALDHQTDYVEIHSHTHDMHITGKCKGGQGGLFKCVDYDIGLEDLKKSREALNGTTYLAYPFGEFTELSINLLKDTGFTMALTTEWRKAQVNDDPYKVPRIYIYNEYSLNTFKSIVN